MAVIAWSRENRRLMGHGRALEALHRGQNRARGVKFDNRGDIGAVASPISSQRLLRLIPSKEAAVSGMPSTSLVAGI